MQPTPVAPTLINLPPPPSNPETPSDMGPGTPNSGTTSLSALSTTAIKDGHQGHVPPHGSSHHHRHQDSTSSSSSTNTLEAERADRISRLAGLERVTTVRGSGGPSSLTPGAAAGGSSGPPPGYFDGANPQIKERSTVGSASATGSAGGRTTWASSSDVNDTDKMSEDDGMSSTEGLSDEGNASLVGFGEGAPGTASGNVSSSSTVGRGAGRQSGVASPIVPKPSAVPPYLQPSGTIASPASSASTTTTTPSVAEQRHDAKMIDGQTYDPNVVDTVTRTPVVVPGQSGGRVASATGAETMEGIIGERIDNSGAAHRPMESPDERGQGLGKFPFEEK
ncbi:MAG: DNA-directed RNA polymerase II core subunit [Chaenotheca gracillima]|nr:MAG: DNA-directed RNA polymerase II core subunit [Chaenotheca gracillima]